MNKKNTLNTLAEEHEQRRGLFTQMDKTSDAAVKTREALLSKIEAGLIPHAKWEEAVFYPAFKKSADREGLKIHAEAIAEHMAVEEVVIPSVKAAEFWYTAICWPREGFRRADSPSRYGRRKNHV